MTEQHTPEKLWAVSAYAFEKNGNYENGKYYPVIALYKGKKLKPTPENRLAYVFGDYHNSDRLQACWNACTGIPTEALESGVIQDLIGRLKDAEAIISGHLDEEEFNITLPKIRATLAKLEGK